MGHGYTGCEDAYCVVRIDRVVLGNNAVRRSLGEPRLRSAKLVCPDNRQQYRAGQAPGRPARLFWLRPVVLRATLPFPFPLLDFEWFVPQRAPLDKYNVSFVFFRLYAALRINSSIYQSFTGMEMESFLFFHDVYKIYVEYLNFWGLKSRYHFSKDINIKVFF